MRFQPGVGLTDRGFGACPRRQDKHRVDQFPRAIARSHHRGFPYTRRGMQHPFHIFGINVQAIGRDDYLLLAAQNFQVAIGGEFADVAGMQPALGIPRRGIGLAKVPWGHVVTPQQHLAIGRDANLHASNGFSHTAFAGMERMVQCRYRSGLGQAIALDHNEAKLSPEFLQRRVKRGRAHHEGPELPSEVAVNAAVLPPADVPFPAAGRGGGVGESCKDIVAQQIEHLGHADHHGNPAASNQVRRFARAETGLEENFPRDQGGNQRRHRLPEHMTQRQQVQETDGRERTHVLSILIDLVVDGFQVGQDIAVSKSDSLWRAGRTRSEQDFRDLIGFGGRKTARGSVTIFQYICEWPDRTGAIHRRPEVRACQQSARRGNPNDVRNNAGRRAEIDGDGNYAFEQATPKGYDPFGTVLTPDDQTLSAGNSRGPQTRCEVCSTRARFGIRDTNRTPVAFQTQKLTRVATPDIKKGSERWRISDHVRHPRVYRANL